MPTNDLAKLVMEQLETPRPKFQLDESMTELETLITSASVNEIDQLKDLSAEVRMKLMIHSNYYLLRLVIETKNPTLTNGLLDHTLGLFMHARLNKTMPEIEVCAPQGLIIIVQNIAKQFSAEMLDKSLILMSLAGELEQRLVHDGYFDGLFFSCLERGSLDHLKVLEKYVECISNNKPSLKKFSFISVRQQFISLVEQAAENNNTALVDYVIAFHDNCFTYLSVSSSSALIKQLLQFAHEYVDRFAQYIHKHPDKYCYVGEFGLNYDFINVIKAYIVRHTPRSNDLPANLSLIPTPDKTPEHAQAWLPSQATYFQFFAAKEFTPPEPEQRNNPNCNTDARRRALSEEGKMLFLKAPSVG